MYALPDFRRYFVPGGMYFYTLITSNRLPLFGNQTARTILGEAIRDELKAHPFKQVAIVLLPDHLHAIWSLPPGDAKYDSRWKAIKAKFTSQWLASGGIETTVAPGYRKQRRRDVWQARFMEHTIQDEQDLHHHCDYLHWNPVKHHLVKCPKDWPWSSFHRLVESGDYPLDWGCSSLSPPDTSRVDVGLIE